MSLKRPVLAFLSLLLIVSTGYATPPDQPNMTAARTALQSARAELQLAEHNKGGHRGKAVSLVSQAIAEVNKGIAFDRRHNHVQSTTEVAIFTSPDQPHMRAALNFLQNAKNSLERATNDKGGHRAKALDLVNHAIDEVNAGIAAAP
jgi:hypothetical protein